MYEQRMVEALENLIYEHLRRLDTNLDRVIDDVADLKFRVTNLEEGQAGIHRRIDRVDARLDRIERRLDLAELPY